MFIVQAIGLNILNIFASSPTVEQNKLECLSLVNFQASLIFVGEVRGLQIQGALGWVRPIYKYCTDLKKQPGKHYSLFSSLSEEKRLMELTLVLQLSIIYVILKI
jgi:hypothetical protein